MEEPVFSTIKPSMDGSDWKPLVSREDFEALRASNKKFSIVYFYNPGCKSCPGMKQELCQLLETNACAEQVEVGTVNTFDLDASELLELHGVSKVPTVVLMKNGVVVQTSVTRTSNDMEKIVEVVSSGSKDAEGIVIVTDCDF